VWIDPLTEKRNSRLPRNPFQELLGAFMEFLDYLTSLAQEGETILVVEQVNGTWPAYLPHKKFKPGASTYVNTGIFKTHAGKISASRAYCEFCAFMVFDDVGTDKAPNMPKVKPTWIMETSEGCFQWGFVFGEQPTKGEFSAAIDAFAAAGYTDPGATNPVRNTRLPGSVNQKPGKGGWVARLVEFNEGTEYTLPELLAAHGVVPGEAGCDQTAVRLTDDGKDDVFAWLMEQGLVISKPNAQGFAGVVCPAWEEHSDGNVEGRYIPLTRSYCCFHSHGAEWDSERFLTWVAEQGGPERHAGLRDTLLSDIMAGALSKLAPSDVFTDVAAQRVAEVELRELSRLDRAEWVKKFAYVMPDDAYFDLDTRQTIARKTFNALFRHVACASMHGKHPKVDASIWLDEQRPQALAGLTYAAGDNTLLQRAGQLYGNRWTDARIQGTGGGVAPWLRHLERLIPVPEERNHLLDVMAHKYQKPTIKINHAILLAGDPGVGKDTLLAPFFVAVGGPHGKNRSLVDKAALESAFGYALESEIMVINELRPDQFRDRRELENKLKPIIAAPPEYLSVNRKGLHPYDAANRILVIAFSNFRDAIALPADDRRWFVLWADSGRMDARESQSLWDWYTRGGFEAVAGYLAQRDISAFMPGATPPMTEAKQIMAGQSMSPCESYLSDLIAERSGDFASGVVASPLYRVINRLQPYNDVKITQGALLHALKEAGWRDMGLVHSAEFPNRKQVWTCLDVSKSELRRLAETPPSAPMLQRVK
jgi:hypothetical protein